MELSQLTPRTIQVVRMPRWKAKIIRLGELHPQDAKFRKIMGTRLMRESHFIHSPEMG
jgi:hypothetical protein